MDAGNPEVTRILNAASAGDRQATEDLIPLVYGELRRLAEHLMANERPGQTLQATALVHEAYQRLSPGEERFDNRAHFFSAAASAMRRILVDRARSKKAVRHGGEMHRTEFAEDLIAAPTVDRDELLAVHEVVDRLAEIEPRKAEAVKLRYFIGLSTEEIAEVLGISAVTVRRDMIYSKAWLSREITEEFEA